jgi:hypothetical protein
MRTITRSLSMAAVVTLLAGAASAQAPQYRDSRTGTVWTPQYQYVDTNPDGTPKGPADRAFDPSTQTAVVRGVVIQRPQASLMGTVPITAGPTVPIITLDTPSLQAIPGGNWAAILYVTNNSANTINANVACQFTNQGQKVQDAHVIVPPAGPGQRLGLPVMGPRVDLHVDRVTCQLVSPM